MAIFVNQNKSMQIKINRIKCILAGPGFGTVVAFQVGGILAYSHFGWPSTFWLVGAMCFVVFLLLTYYGASCPATHKSLSIKEKEYIIGHMSTRVQTVCHKYNYITVHIFLHSVMLILKFDVDLSKVPVKVYFK